VNTANPYNVTPLLEATGEGHLEMARFLIEHGAEVDFTGMSEGSPLTLAAYCGKLELLQLLLAAGADPNLSLPGGGETALHMAAVRSHTEAVLLLLHAAANPNLHAKSGVVTSMFDGSARVWGETPLHYAAAYGDEAMVQAMLQAGADRQARNVHGETPMEYACRHQRPRGIRNLLK
jgi:ankyrin repeat protein